jgi:hypothetical protein
MRTEALLILSFLWSCVGAKPLKIAVISWNVAGQTLTQDDCSFIGSKSQDCDVVVVGVQEVGALTDHNTKPSCQLRQKIRLNLKNYCSSSETTHGTTQLLVYTHKDVAPPTCVTWEVTCGIGKIVKNKGGLGVVLNLEGHRCAFIMAHLAAHQTRVDARNQDFSRILQETDTSLAKAGTSLGDIDFLCFGGDLNYRIDLTREEVELSLLSDGEFLSELGEHDQLTKARASLADFFGFSEPTVRFRPTFKFDKGTSQYDTSAKRRIPAWTDRILFRSAPGYTARAISYGAEEVLASDHRPVCARFELIGYDTKRTENTRGNKENISF